MSNATTSNNCTNSMTEREWVDSLIPKLQEAFPKYKIAAEKKLPYTCDVREYEFDNERTDDTPIVTANEYKTDILIYEENTTCWKPRVVIEAKVNSVSTHDVITYSHKASTHKYIHPYLRYGIFIANRGNKALPGRLFRHGAQFDFMMSWEGCTPHDNEWDALLKLISKEIKASVKLEEILYDARNKTRNKYSMLHRPLIVRN